MPTMNEELDDLNEILSLCKDLTPASVQWLIRRLQKDLARQAPGQPIGCPGGEREQLDYKKIPK